MVLTAVHNLVLAEFGGKLCTEFAKPAPSDADALWATLPHTSDDPERYLLTLCSAVLQSEVADLRMELDAIKAQLGMNGGMGGGMGKGGNVVHDGNVPVLAT